MNPLIRKLLSWSWPFLLLGGYLAYRWATQYSDLPASFSSFDEARLCAWRLKFPGGGLRLRTGTSDRPGEGIRLYAVELLFRQKDRVFVVAGKDGDFGVIDEFLSGPSISSVELKLGKLRYLDSKGRVIVERDAREKPNKPAPGNAGLACGFRFELPWPGVPEPGRSAVVTHMPNTHRKTLTFLSLMGLLLIGCSATSSRAGGYVCWPHDPIVVAKGEGRDFTPQELVEVARRHAERENVTAVDFSNPSPNVIISTKRRPMLAQVTWGRGLGELCLTIEIDRRGHVMRHWVAIARCGYGSPRHEYN